MLEAVLRRAEYRVAPVTPQIAADQQKIADTFFELKLIPKPIVINEALPGAALVNTAAK